MQGNKDSVERMAVYPWSRRCGGTNVERERDQHGTQSRKEVTESNAEGNSTPQKPRRLNVGYESKVTNTEGASVQVRQTLICTHRMT